MRPAPPPSKDELIGALKRAKVAFKAATDALGEVRLKRIEAMRRASAGGLSWSEIARHVGVTRARAHALASDTPTARKMKGRKVPLVRAQAVAIAALGEILERHGGTCRESDLVAEAVERGDVREASVRKALEGLIIDGHVRRVRSRILRVE